ncbi:MAG TPA: phosphate/phosphite/phosphonate ABC transporter substrate-binding protein [Thermodesulfovibrionales bacterium]|nr:phosphate/phosphite/phosphonate ABC transporter substrate-binding protein [Thermodesulfovibrionales bacterium]
MKKSLEIKVVGIVAGMVLAFGLVAGLMSLYIQRATVLSMTGSSSETTARVVHGEISLAMLEGKADVIRESVANLKKISTVEEITVVNSEGREAFNPNSPVKDSAMIEEFRRGRESFSNREGGRFIYSMPLFNAPSCQKCHGTDKPLLGAVKISVSLEREFADAAKRTSLMVSFMLLLSLGFGFLLWIMLRRMLVSPIKAIEASAMNIGEGDLSFDTDIRGDDELGRLSRLLKESSMSLGGIFVRIKDLSGRIARVAEGVEEESGNLVRGAEVEAEAVSNILKSVEEINENAAVIADGTEGLAASVEETSSSMEEMVSSIGTVNANIHELSSAVETTSSSIEELSATIGEVAASASELAASAEETLSAISEITAAVREVEQHAKESALQSEKVTSEAATIGMTSMEKTIEGMGKIKTSVERTATFIEKLGGRSDEIDKILTVIDDVTDQTTLLALNAAILAAQAGEHGKGFSVVAEEIKELAERAAFSTQEIASLIQSVQEEVRNAGDAVEAGLDSVEHGFKLAKDAGDALKKILDSSRKSSEMSRFIERSTAEQAKATKLVTGAMGRVRSMIDHIEKATAGESKGIMLIIQATEKMRDVSRQVSKAIDEQKISSRQISGAVELTAERSQRISRSLSDHKFSSQCILNVIDGVKGIPAENRMLAFRISNSLRDLQKYAELLRTETERFRFYKGGDSVMRLGVLPLESPAVMFKKFAPLAHYLSRALGRTVELKVAVDFESALEDIGENITQFCVMGASTYIEAQRRYGVKVLVKGLRDGKPYHHSAIITRADSGIRSVGDLRGRSFGFGDARSASGHIAPRLMLKEAGIGLDDLRHYHFFGYHDEVARAVLRGDVDAGAVIDPVARKFRDEGLQILMTSDEIPELNICANKFVNDADVSLMTTVLVSLNALTDEGKRVLKSIDESYTGFVDAHDADYDSVRLKISKLGIR